MLHRLAKQASTLSAMRLKRSPAKVEGLKMRNSVSVVPSLNRSLLSSFQRRSYMVPSFSMDTNSSANSIIVSQAVADVCLPSWIHFSLVAVFHSFSPSNLLFSPHSVLKLFVRMIITRIYILESSLIAVDAMVISLNSNSMILLLPKMMCTYQSSTSPFMLLMYPRILY